MDCLVDRKRELRAAIRSARAALSDVEKRSAARSVRDRLRELDELGDASAVMLYAASTDELSLDDLARDLAEDEVTLGFPRVEGPYLLSIRWADLDDGTLWTAGSFGIREPIDSTLELDPEAIDVVLVPGLAFTRDGRRMGYGGGFYDNLLPRLRLDCLRVGACFDEQVVDDLPCDDRDERVDVLVAPSGTWRTGAR